MITVKRIKGGTDNCYIVAEGKSAILVDTSSKAARDMVIEECDKYEIKLIVLTHFPPTLTMQKMQPNFQKDIPAPLHSTKWMKNFLTTTASSR